MVLSMKKCILSNHRVLRIINIPIMFLSWAFYGLKQTPRQWYERLSNFLLSHGYERGMIDKNLFIKKANSEIILVQIYVADIIFGATKDSLCEEFVAAMQGEFEMSMMGELSFFLGLQVKQSMDGIFLCQSKYCKEILKKFEMESCKEASTPMPPSCYMDADVDGKGVYQTQYRGLIGSLLYLTAVDRISCLLFVFVQDIKQIQRNLTSRLQKGFSNISKELPMLVYGCKLDRKSTSGTFHLLGSSLISWHSKKQACVALSTAEAEYIAAGSCCAQILWLKQQLADFGLKINKVLLQIQTKTNTSNQGFVFIKWGEIVDQERSSSLKNPNPLCLMKDWCCCCVWVGSG
ncbi:uncharacterized mitochondrial protein AtMg00810-like [Phaseolus vulgaris]|uniref:uncharacterized mitochondrial protein AtMg00810-like n=1 Tax=Phaseolus vulgaris TaxID=3885 RepID=UPI0035CBCF24